MAIYGSLVPLRYTPVDFEEALQRFAQLPFRAIDFEHRADWATNVLLFVPIGFCWMGAILVDRRGSPARWIAAPLVVAGGMTLSAAVEFTQTFFPPRTVSQNDILAETIGASAGTGLWLAFGQRVTNWLRNYTVRAGRPTQMQWLLQAYVAGLVVFSLLPLNLTIHPAELYRKYRAGRIVLLSSPADGWGVSEIWNRCADLLIFVPAGAWAAVAFRSRSGEETRSLPRSVVVGLSLVAGIEAAQVFVESRYAEAFDVLTGLLGVAAGAWLARRLGRTRCQAQLGQPRSQAEPGNEVLQPAGEQGLLQRVRWPALIILYAGFLCVFFWWPLEVGRDGDAVRSSLEGFFAVPFARLHRGSDFNAATEIVRKTVLFAPLGAMIAWLLVRGRPVRRTRKLLLIAGATLCIGLGTGIELVQAFLPPHIPDITDVILYTTGSGVGMLIVVRLNSPSRGPE